MVVICVKKSWIVEIGEMARHIHFHDQTSNCVVLLGREKIRAVHPFVEIDVLVADVTSGAFVPVHIPSSMIIGMFDLTEDDAKAYGFHSPEKK